jgi:hypothetical protein
MPRAFVFDAYGTLFDVHAAINRHRAAAGPDADRFSEIWRTKQLEYSWTLTLAGRYLDFWMLHHTEFKEIMQREKFDISGKFAGGPNSKAASGDVRVDLGFAGVISLGWGRGPRQSRTVKARAPGRLRPATRKRETANRGTIHKQTNK